MSELTAIPLRGGSQTSDVRLDRVYPGVERHLPSLRYLTSDLTATKKPRSFTWNFRTYDPHLDQGREGACVGFGWAHELACYPAIVPDVSFAYARERIYWQAQRRDQWDGGAYPGASPFGEGTSVLAGAQVVQQELHLIGNYDWCLTLEDLILSAGYLGPIVMGTDWMTGMFDTDDKGYVHATGQVEGGHCWLIRGVSLAKNSFLCRNSWGESWGMRGDFWISFGDAGALLAAQGEACVPRRRVRA